MILYSDRDDHYSQRVRIVLAEKDISAEIKEAKPEEAWMCMMWVLTNVMVNPGHWNRVWSAQ